MKNKKSFSIILLTLALFLYGTTSIYATSYEELQNITFDMDEDITYDEPICTNGEAAGDYTIKWNGRKNIMGAIYNKYQKSDSVEETLDEKYNTREEAEAAEDSFLDWTKPACCDTDDPKDGGCKDSSACNEPHCQIDDVDCDSIVTDVSGTCGCGIKKPSGLIFDTGISLSCSKDKTTCDDVCSPGVGISGSCSTTTKTQCKYRVQCSKNKFVPTGEWVDGERNIYTYYYEMDIEGTRYDKDDVYCVQPGAHGPGLNGLPYVFQSFDISKCKDQFTKYNSETNRDENAVYCGLAHIMYQAYNINADTLKFTTFKSDRYTPAALILALRLWMAAYGKGANGPGLGLAGAEEAVLGWIPKEGFYDVTASLIKNGQTYRTENEYITIDKVEGRIGCAEEKYGDTPGRCVIDQAIELFHNTEVVEKENYLGGLNFNKSTPVVRIIDDSREIEITWDDEDSIQKISQECNDFNNPKCIIEPHAYIYVNGNMVDVTDRLKLEKEFCVKNTCRFIPKGIMEICIQGGTYVKVVLVFKNWSQAQGEIRFYTHASDNNNQYQIMMSMGSKISECYQNGIGTKTGRIEREIDCGCIDGCSDLESKVSYETNAICNPKTTVSDASTNCIVNACDPKTVAEYDVTSEYSVNPQVCTLYEREDNELYIPGVVSVYSGMQFSYDLAKDLAKRGINVKSNKKLTNVIIQKKQITAQIHYDYWKGEYDRKYALLEDAYSSTSGSNYSNEYKRSLKQDIANWVNALKNCNMYADKSLVTEINNKVDALVRCTDSSCNAANVAIEYKSAASSNNGEKKYGEKQTLAVERNKLSNEKYYCHGSSCYTYSSRENPTEPKMTNYTTNIDNYEYIYNKSAPRRITIPANLYATTINNIEHDYYNDRKYYTEAYSGNVVSSDSDDGNTTSLADYSYPISGNTKTNISGYPVKFYFTDLSNKKLRGYSTTSSCLIKVYNRTTAYDCKITDSNGNVRLDNCEDTKYNIENGIPIIDENQINWIETNKKQYGFVARFIDLDNPFPNGLQNRGSVINWTSKDVEEIVKTANDIYTNPSYLEYSYILTPNTIKEIKEYNKNAGGYSNSTLENCVLYNDEESGLSMFKDCKSTFLHREIRKYDGVQISGNKAGAY